MPKQCSFPNNHCGSIMDNGWSARGQGNRWQLVFILTTVEDNNLFELCLCAIRSHIGLYWANDITGHNMYESTDNLFSSIHTVYARHTHTIDAGPGVTLWCHVTLFYTVIQEYLVNCRIKKACLRRWHLIDMATLIDCVLGRTTHAAL